MKVLFVCRHSVGRSQIAKAYYNALTNSNDAEAAGTHVAEKGQTLLQREKVSPSKKFFLLEVMKDAGIDISDYQRIPLQHSDIDTYDVIIDMGDKRDTPDWLLESPKYIHWDVKDPRNQDYEVVAEIRDEIKSRVENFIR
jgi:protein-tyrosine-phosphatase